MAKAALETDQVHIKVDSKCSIFMSDITLNLLTLLVGAGLNKSASPIVANGTHGKHHIH